MAKRNRFFETSLENLIDDEIDFAFGYVSDWKKWGSVCVRNAELELGDGLFLVVDQVRGYAGQGTKRSSVQLKTISGEGFEGYKFNWTSTGGELSDQPEDAIRVFDLIKQAVEYREVQKILDE